MPDETGGFVYVDLEGRAAAARGLRRASPAQSLPSSTTENLGPLRSLLAWTNAEGETRTFDAFLEIK